MMDDFIYLPNIIHPDTVGIHCIYIIIVQCIVQCVYYSLAVLKLL